MLRYLPFAALTFALLLSACGGDGEATPSPTEPVSSPSPSPGATAEPSPDASPEASPGASSLTPSATGQPTQQPAEQPTAVPLVFESVTSLVAQGEKATVAVQTEPDTPCSIVVTRTTFEDPDYVGTQQKFEVMQLPGLEPAVSDESGRVSWSWRLEADTEADKWKATVICGRGAAAATVSSELEVVERQ